MSDRAMPIPMRFVDAESAILLSEITAAFRDPWIRAELALEGVGTVTVQRSEFAADTPPDGDAVLGALIAKLAKHGIQSADIVGDARVTVFV